MARFYPSGGTGGADVSVVTAMEDDVAKGKVIVGPDGEPMTGELELTGTAADSQVLAGQTYYNTDLHQKRTGAMANQGAWKSEGLAAGAEVAIPPGYHNGGGKVTAKDLVSQTPGDATAAQIWDGRKAWVNGQQVMGTLATQGGSTTIPGTAAKTIVTPNKIVTGNIAVAGDPNLIPANIKKDAVIFGVRGIHSGYVSSPTDLYLRGNNIKNFISVYDINGDLIFDVGQITYQKTTSSSYGYGGTITSDLVDVSGFSKLNVECNVPRDGGCSWILLGLSASKLTGDWSNTGKYNLTSITHNNPPLGNHVLSLDISAINKLASAVIKATGGLGPGPALYVYRVWLS